MEIQVKAKLITQDNFREYGRYINVSTENPTYADDYFHWWNELDIIELGGKASIGMVRPNFNPQFDERLFEQHNHSPEMLCPLDRDIIVLVGKSDVFDVEPIDKDKFDAFIVPRGTIVGLNPGVWHHAPMVFAESGNVLVIFKEDTSIDDMITKDLKSLGIEVRVIL